MHDEYSDDDIQESDIPCVRLETIIIIEYRYNIEYKYNNRI